MEKVDGKIYEMYTALKKRKRRDDEVARQRKAEFRKFHDVTMAWVKDLEAKNQELRQKMSDILDEQKRNREAFMEEIRAKDEEVLRLNLLLAESNDIAEPLNAVLQSPTPTLQGKKTSQSSSRAKRVQFSKKAIAPNSSNLEEESQELECSRNRTSSTGDETNESSGVYMYHKLLESLFCMKISLNKGTEGFSFSACHEDTGYSFTLTWLEQRNMWRYQVSSLGSLESVVASDWMKQDIIFGMDMCPLFFERISKVIG